MSDSWVGEHDPLDDGWALDDEPAPRASKRMETAGRARAQRTRRSGGWAIAEAGGAANEAVVSHVDPELKAARIAALDLAVSARRRDATDAARAAVEVVRRRPRPTPDYRAKRTTERGLAEGPPPAPSKPREPTPSTPPAARPSLRLVPPPAVTQPGWPTSAADVPPPAVTQPGWPTSAAVVPSRRSRPAPVHAPARATSSGLTPAGKRHGGARPRASSVRTLEPPPPLESPAAVEAPRRARSTSPEIDVATALERAPTQPWSRTRRGRFVPAWFAVGAAAGAALALAVVWGTSSGAQGGVVTAAEIAALEPTTESAPAARLVRIGVAPDESPLELLALDDDLEPATPAVPVRAATYSLPSSFSDHVAAARAASRRGDHEGALAAIDRALAIRAHSGSALDLKARVLRDLHETVWALEVATEAVHAAPERAASWLTKALLLIDLGELDHARFALEYVIDLAPGSRHAVRARALLARL